MESLSIGGEMSNKHDISQWIVENQALVLGIDIVDVLRRLGVEGEEREQALRDILYCVKKWDDHQR